MTSFSHNEYRQAEPKANHPRMSLLLLLALAAPLPAQDFSLGPGQNSENVTRTQANAALEARDYPKALTLLAPLAAAHPKDAHLLYDLASTQDALDQTTAAESTYRAAIADDPTLLKARVALGLLLARADKLLEARTELAAAATQPGDPALRARADRALARIDQKTRPADALDEILAALKLSPETPEDTLLTAELAQSAGDPADSEAAYRRLLATHPGDPEASAALAHLLLTQNRTPDAEAILTHALATHPDDPTLVTQLAIIYSAQGKTTQALPLVQTLHRTHPADPNIIRILAGLELDTKDYAAAEPLLAALRRENPADPVLADEHADALIHLKRSAEAQQILTPLVSTQALWPGKDALATAAGHLAFAASSNNDPAAALRALDVRATVAAPSPPVLFLAAISYDKLHQTKQAQAAYKAFLAAANGSYPDEEFEARHRLPALEHRK